MAAEQNRTNNENEEIKKMARYRFFSRLHRVPAASLYSELRVSEMLEGNKKFSCTFPAIEVLQTEVIEIEQSCHGVNDFSHLPSRKRTREQL